MRDLLEKAPYFPYISKEEEQIHQKFQHYTASASKSHKSVDTILDI